MVSRIAMAIFFILFGLVALVHVAISPVILGVIALVAGIALLAGA